MTLPRHQISALFNVADIRQMEQDLFKTQDSFTVMQNAAVGLFDEIMPILKADYLPKYTPTVHVVLGCGNNAGDGLLLASFLQLAGQAVTAVFDKPNTRTPKKNIKVTAYRVFDKPFSGDAEKAYQTAQQRGVKILPFEAFSCKPYDVIVEAIFGIGLDRPITDLPHVAIAHINQIKADLPHVSVIAVDIPAGIDADTGAASSIYLQADKTVTFIADKIGLHTADGKGASGEVVVKPLGANLPHVAPIRLYDYQNNPLNSHGNQHKGDFGHALTIGGDRGMFGAAALSAVSSLKVGAGKSSIFAHPDYYSQYHLENTPLYEVMRCQNVSDLSAYSAVILGTGLGRTTWGKQLFEQTIKAIYPTLLPLIIDADGLFHLADMNKNLPNVAVITPHEAEAARLLHTDIHRVRLDKPTAVKQLAQRFGCVAVLKGAGTLISDGQTVWVNSTGNVNLATAGTGDVLAGMIGGLLAQGFTPLDAALYGVYRHGFAADQYTKHHEGKTLRATELWDYL